MATLQEIKDLLEGGGFTIKSERRVNDRGTAVRTTSGTVVNVWDNGNVTVQGKAEPAVKALVQGNGGSGVGPAAPAPTPAAPTPASPTRVFVVYGHDQAARTQLEAMLRRWGLEPLILDQLASSGLTIIEKLEKYRAEAVFAVVLATPDDEGHKAGAPDQKLHRARQNVVLELGMMLALLGRERVAILIQDQTQMERPSDIQGLIYIPFRDSVNDVGPTLAKEMATQGIPIDVRNL